MRSGAAAAFPKRIPFPFVEPEVEKRVIFPAPVRAVGRPADSPPDWIRVDRKLVQSLPRVGEETEAQNDEVAQQVSGGAPGPDSGSLVAEARAGAAPLCRLSLGPRGAAVRGEQRASVST